MRDEKLRPEIRLLVTDRCNYKCVYCPYFEGRIKQPEISLNQVYTLAEIARNNNLPHIHLTGGEPLLREDLAEIIRALKIGVENVALTTNASRLTEHYLNKMEEAGLDELHVHIPSLEISPYQKITGSDDDPDRIIKIIRKTEIPTKINVPIIPCNRSEIRGVLDYFSGQKITIALIECITPDPSLHVSIDDIRGIIYNFDESLGEKKPEPNWIGNFGECYERGEMIIQAVPRKENCVEMIKNPNAYCNIDEENRIWVSGNSDSFYFSTCLYKQMEKMNAQQLERAIHEKYINYWTFH